MVADASLLLPDKTEITGLTADSREVRPGWLFAALPGSTTNGQDFIKSAIEKGAAAILTSEGFALPDLSVSVITDPEPRRRFARLAAEFYLEQPDAMVAVTGTNGKSSVVDFTRQIWTHAGKRAASLGTLGLVAPKRVETGTMTTPDPVRLYKTLAELAKDGVSSVAFEASSHGLAQHRLDGVRLKAAAFTNLSRDHLDYHVDMSRYWQAKKRLFSELLPKNGIAVINADTPEGQELIAECEKRGQIVFDYGFAARKLRIVELRPNNYGQTLVLAINDVPYPISLPLAGKFQVYNAICALGLALASHLPEQAALSALSYLKGVPGRMEKVGETRDGAAIIVDYAHTPDAMRTVLEALRPHTKSDLWVLFGCGGDRDQGKRPIMGKIATEKADKVIVTDDNPRNENKTTIRAQILAEAPGAIEIGDRGEAIAYAISHLKKGDVLAILGKGHETGQTEGDIVRPFSDQEQALKELRSEPLWTRDEAAEAVLGEKIGPDWSAYGVSIDSRTVKKGDLFIALVGPLHDGHDHVKAALEKGAAAALAHRIPEGLPADAPILLVKDSMAALNALGRRARTRTRAKIIAITGSVGKTTTKEMTRAMLAASGETYATEGNLNNHWGVPLSLARMPITARYGVFELGMNHKGEISRLTALARPDVAVITAIEDAHMEFFDSLADIAYAKAEIFEGLNTGGVAVLPAGHSFFSLLAEKALVREAEIRSFGTLEGANAQMLQANVGHDGTDILARIDGRKIRYRIAVPGLQWATNSLAALLAVNAVGVKPEKAVPFLDLIKAPKGRGERTILPWGQGVIEIIDEAYNASPVSMRAAIMALAHSEPGSNGRRIAILGDMLELGERSGDLHEALMKPLMDASIDLVFVHGPMMRRLWDVLPERMKGAYEEKDVAILAEKLKNALIAGDVAMAKGSAGSRTSLVVDILKKANGGNAHAL